jgi:hypothetical protein
MKRRLLCIVACLVASFGVAILVPVTGTSAGLVRIIQPKKVGDLKEQIKSQLRPRSPREFAFLDRVVDMVEKDQLPLRIVKATFNWARKKHRRYRFPYFQRALQIEAAKLGIKVQ